MQYHSMKRFCCSCRLTYLCFLKVISFESDSSYIVCAESVGIMRYHHMPQS